MTRRLTIKALRERSPWEIAQQLGIRYTGDNSPIPHGGTFYETSNWESNGYADGVRFQEAEGVLYVECITINRPDDIADLEAALESSGWKLDDDNERPGMVRQYGELPIELTPEIEIEAQLHYSGVDVEDCATFRSDNGESWGEFPEFRAFQWAVPHITRLIPEREKQKFPTVKEIRALLVSLKSDIADDYRADDEIDVPSMCVTIGWDDRTGNWSYQTGDNSYSGSAYGYPHWAVITLTRRSNSTELARDVLSQLADLATA